MSDLNRDTPEPLNQLRAKFIDDRYQQLNGLLNSTTSAVWTYLLTVNGGAAAGILAFIGAKQDLAKAWWPYLVLISFTVGLVLVGLAHAFRVHKAQQLADGWVADTGDYWRNVKPWSEVVRRDDQRVESWAPLPWVLGWLSLICFVLGVAVSAWGFRTLAVTQ